MALTTAQQVRVKIQDAPIIADLTLYGDGTAVTFKTEQANLTSGSAFVPVGSTAWSATGVTFNASGFYTFATVLSANSAYRITYVYSTFSDDEIDHFVTVGGNVLGAAKEACEALMFDAVKRARWMASDGSQYDDTSAQSHLRGLYDQLIDQLEREATSAGGFNSWAEDQGNW